MRSLLGIGLLLAATAAGAQTRRPFVEAGVGPGGEGVGARVAVGLNARALTPLVRLTVSEGEFESEFREGERFRQGNVEVGLGLSRTLDVAGPVALGGGVGVAVALATRDEADEERSSFNVPGLEVGLTLPVEATALVRVSEHASMSLTGYRSVPLGTASSQEPTPEDRERFNPGIGQWGAALGLRFAL